MHFVVLALTALAVYLLPAHAYVYSTAELCTTRYGRNSVSVKTTSYALTIPITFSHRLTITPTSTITPPPQTTTTTTTSTATSVVTTTSTATLTETDSATSTFTATTVITTDTTTTTTTTSSADVYTVPTPAGFTPLALEVGYVPRKRFAEVTTAPAPAIRGRQVEERTASKNQLCPQPGNPSSWQQYPQKVICAALVLAETTSTKTITAKSTISTTLPVSTSTTTSTVTTTVTSTTAAIPATTTTTTTLTFSTTTTASSTTTTTATQTVTTIQASSTVYAACSSNNVVNSANGNQGIYQVYYAGSGTQPTTIEVAISDPVACCETCQQEVGCTGYAQYPGEARCFYFTNGQCDGSQNLGQFFKTSASFAPSDGYTLGNGQCGQIGNGGSG